LLAGRETEAPAWLAAGLPAGAPVVCATDERAARHALRRPDVNVAIFDLHEDSAWSVAILEDVPTQFPSVATVGMASRMHVHPDELLRVARAGVHSVLFEEDRRFPLLVRSALTAAVTRLQSDRVWGAVAPDTPPRVRPLVAYGLKNSHENLTVDLAARALGVHRKTLAERCSVAGSPPPQIVLGWCRLLSAAILLEEKGRAVDHVAHELGFASGAAFRNMLKRYTGLNPGELRSRGTVKELARQFRTAMTPPSGHPALIRVG